MHSDGSSGTSFKQRYELGELIGSGGMGRVYRGRDRVLDRPVAIKLLAARVSDDETAKRRFLREARTAAALEHPNIAPVYDAGETEEGDAYLAMPLYEGRTLKERLAERPLPPEEALRIALALADSLEYAHSQGIIHRDLKPSNVMVTNSGQVKLIDFGLATHSGSSLLTATGDVMGTPAYMAPEQVRGEASDTRTDIWALGVVLYEMLVGHRPFDGDGHALRYAIVNSEPQMADIPELGSPGVLREILDRALRKDSSKRWSRAREIGDRLRPLAGTLDTQVPTARWPRPSRPGPRRSVWLVAVVLIALVAAFWVWQSAPADLPSGGEVLAVLPFENGTGDPQMNHVAEGLAAGLVGELAGLRGVCVANRSESWRLAAAGLGISAIGERLEATMIIEGRLIRIGETLTVTVSASDPAGSELLWTEDFDGTVQDVFALQQGIARGVSRFLALPLSREQRRRLARGGPSARAFDYYLEGIERLEHRENPRNAEFAVDLFRQALRLQSDFAAFHAGLADALWEVQEKRPSASLAAEVELAARTALKLDPQSPSAHVALARALRAQGQYAESIAELRPVLATHPKPDEAFRELAWGYALTSDAEARGESLRSAVALGPENWLNWDYLGVFLVEEGDVEEARKAFERAVELAPGGVRWPRLNLGGLKIIQGDFAGAIADFEATGATTADADLASNMGSAYFFAGQLDRAEAQYRVAVELRPDDPVGHRNLGDALEASGRSAEAREEFRLALRFVEASLEAEPRDLVQQGRRALFEAKSGYCEAAVLHGETLRTLVPDTCDVHLHLAGAFALCGASDLALASVRICVEAGFPGDFLSAQAELVSLGGDPRFEALTGTEH